MFSSLAIFRGKMVGNNNGEYLYSAFPHIRAQSALTLIITPIDQVSICNHLNFLGSIQSGCLLDAQRLAF